MPNAPGRRAWSRRQWMQWATGAGAAAVAMWRVPALAEGATPPPVPKELTPDAAIELLSKGNQRFVEGKTFAPNRNMARLKEVAPKQTPFAAFLGCADSRVPTEIVFDQGFGDVFVTRIAGNVADPAIIGSLEFGCLVLGAKVLYVLGHSSCGAVAATLKGDAVPGQISTLYQHIRLAAKASQGNLDTAIRENVKHQAGVLAEASPVLAVLLKEGRLKVAGGVYDLMSGKVTQVSV
ncbi:MAG: carbonic anhydrase [Myxococcaceae bacterium]|jgi:carbonic anhydrase|nr:carbonic anhydrase [Myxococcaceae bacterium]MCA3013174.1 carbonic anhydrase [Myxococcaceae bacterium]